MAKKQFKTAIANNIPQKKGINNLISSTAEPQEEPKHISEIIKEVTPITTEESYIRQTFIIKEEFLEKLKDLTHQRKQKDYYITQKEVLEEILETYFKNYGDIPPRPDKVKKLEQERGKKIRAGKKN